MRVAIIGAGPAGVYAADILTKADRDFEVSIDLFDQYPAPYGLIRYGVAPDHPRIKGIVNALEKVLDRGDIRFLGNVNYGRDLTLKDFRHFYDAIIFATGALKDARWISPGLNWKAHSAAPTSSPGTTATRTCPATGPWMPGKSPSSATGTWPSTSRASFPNMRMTC